MILSLVCYYNIMKDEKNTLSESNKLIELITEIVPNNEKFLLNKTEESYIEVIELINDTIDYVKFFAETEDKNDYVESSMFFLIHHIVLPNSYAIYTDLMIGNLPACFMELRTMVEALPKCYFAESYEASFHMEKIRLLEKYMKKKNISISSLLSRLDSELNQKDGSHNLWKELSEGWIHLRGIVSKWMEELSENSSLLSYRLIIPTDYSDEDIGTINELQKCINRFRDILRLTIEKYEANKS